MSASLQNTAQNMQLIVWVSQEDIVKESLERYKTSISNEISNFIAKVGRLINSTHVTQVPTGNDLPSQVKKVTLLFGVSALQFKLAQIAEVFKQKQSQLHKITPAQLAELRRLSQIVDVLENNKQRLNHAIAKVNAAKG
jgi:hypothetical protein